MKSSPTTIREDARDIALLAETDVLVCGAGPAGVGAALAAARAGARTFLVEKEISFGGMATSGMLNRLGPYHDQKEIILGGLPWEILRRLIDRGLAQSPVVCSPEDWSNYWLVFDPEGMKRLLDEMICDAGVSIRLGTQVAAPIVDNGAVKGAIVESKSGREAILAKVVVDCTGDADVAARAGAAFEAGRENDKLMQPFTLMSKYLNMDWPKAFRYVNENHARLTGLAREEVGNDFVLAGTDNYLHKEETYFNCLHMHGVDGTNADDLTRSAIELRRKLWGNMEILRRHVPGCENMSLIATAAALGIRESRRIVGEYTLTAEDVLNARRFPDQIYRYACYVDIHEPRPGTRSELAGRNLEPGESYGVPYRCLLPRNVENLLVAGRCLSATHEALASVRMMPSCIAMGQAAGTAAAMSVAESTTPRATSTPALQARLSKDGVIL